MRAIVVRGFGFDGLHLEDVAPPVAGDDGVVLAVHAAALNPYDAHFLRGTPLVGRPFFGLRRPRRRRTGVDVAGTVIEVGKAVTRCAPGDAVFGTAEGSVAERVATTESALVAMPPGLGFAEAAAIPLAGFTALQGLRDAARVAPGQRVAIHGAAGGIGTLAVQLAKWLGAETTAVCRGANVELLRRLGADRVVDYQSADFLVDAARYDVLFDCVGDRPLSACRRALADGGTYVQVGVRMGRVVAPLGRLLAFAALARAVRAQRLVSVRARRDLADLTTLRDLVAAGTVRPVVDRTFRLAETRAAMRHLDQGHPRGKVVILMESAA